MNIEVHKIQRNFVKNGNFQKIFWLGVNGYIIINEMEKEILLIDPWPSYKEFPILNLNRIKRLTNWLIKKADKENYKLIGIIGTHEHFDHIADIPIIYSNLKKAKIKLPPFYSDEGTLNVVETRWWLTGQEIGFKETVQCTSLKLHGIPLYYNDKIQKDKENETIYPLVAGTKLKEITIGDYLITPYIWDHTSTSNVADSYDDIKSGNYQRCTAIFLKSIKDQKTSFFVGSAGEMDNQHTGNITGKFVKDIKIKTDILIQAITHKIFLFHTYLKKLLSLITYQKNNITVNDKIIATHFENFTDTGGRTKANYINAIEEWRNQLRIEMYAIYLARAQEKWTQIYYMKRFLIEYNEDDIENDIKKSEVLIEEKVDKDFWLRFSTVSYF